MILHNFFHIKNYAKNIDKKPTVNRDFTGAVTGSNPMQIYRMKRFTAKNDPVFVIWVRAEMIKSITI